jgi:hypothetical protein
MFKSAEAVHFAAEFEPAVLDRRRSPRAPVSFDAKLGRGGFDRALCRVVNLSLHGARIQTYSSVKSGTVLWLTFPETVPVAARVVWADEFEAGCEFTQPLDPTNFARLIARG